MVEVKLLLDLCLHLKSDKLVDKAKLFLLTSNDLEDCFERVL